MLQICHTHKYENSAVTFRDAKILHVGNVPEKGYDGVMIKTNHGTIFMRTPHSKELKIISDFTKQDVGKTVSCAKFQEGTGENKPGMNHSIKMVIKLTSGEEKHIMGLSPDPDGYFEINY